MEPKNPNKLESFKPGKQTLQLHNSKVTDATKDFLQKNKRKLPDNLSKDMKQLLLDQENNEKKVGEEARRKKIQDANSMALQRSQSFFNELM